MSTPKNIAVILRVYSRVDDVLANLEIIKSQWKKHHYHLFVVHNGKNDGHILDKSVNDMAEIIELEHNSSHRSGATELVNVAHEYLKNKDFDYYLFVESDFWLLSDELIEEAIQSNKDLATTIWIESRKSLAVDFFLVKKHFLDAHPNLLDWKASPETDMRDNALASEAKTHIFNTLRPVHLPSTLRKWGGKLFENDTCEGGRFRLFYKAKALTQHVETLPQGIKTKKAMTNALLGYQFFPDTPLYSFTLCQKYLPTWTKYFPQSSWLRLLKNQKKTLDLYS